MHERASARQPMRRHPLRSCRGSALAANGGWRLPGRRQRWSLAAANPPDRLGNVNGSQVPAGTEPRGYGLGAPSRIGAAVAGHYNGRMDAVDEIKRKVDLVEF